MTEMDEYGLFLETWKPSRLSEYSTLSENLSDPYILERLLDDSSAQSDVERRPSIKGEKKSIGDTEQKSKCFDFFVSNQSKWSEEFIDYVICKGVPEEKLFSYLNAFKNDWVDGRKRRQNSDVMMSIKASLRDYDRMCSPEIEGKYVQNSVSCEVEPLFNLDEIAFILEANFQLLDALLPDYIDRLNHSFMTSMTDIYVRRGANMPMDIPPFRKELNYLTSYSLAIDPVEQFAQIHSKNDLPNPCIFSAPIQSVQDRVVAFAPFISGMDLDQLELVVAPPDKEVPLLNRGEYGGICEYRFD